MQSSKDSKLIFVPSAFPTGYNKGLVTGCYVFIQWRAENWEAWL